MLIRTKFRLLVAVTSIVAVAGTVVVILMSLSADASVERARNADLIIKEVFELNLLFDDFFAYPSGRVIAQIRAKHKRIDTFIEKQSAPGVRIILENFTGKLLAAQDDIERVLNELLAAGNPSEETQKRSQGLMKVKLYEMSFNASQLSQAALDERNIIRTFTFYVIALTAVALSMLAFVILTLMKKGLINPIFSIAEGMRKISAGNLNFRIRVGKKDELGRISESYNNMAGKLKQLYESMEQKIEERTQQLSQENAEDDAIFDSIGEGLVVIDNEAIIKHVNHEAERMFGWKKKDMEGKKFYTVWDMEDKNGNTVPPEKRPLYIALSQARQIHTTDYKYLCRKRIKFPVSITATPVILDGAAIGAVATFRDITKEKEIDRAKNEFVSLASHQLRSPISIVLWYAEMLISGEAGHIALKQKKLLKEIYGASKHMADLVSSLLDVSRIELGVLALNPEQIPVRSFLRKISDEHNDVIIKKRLHFTRTVSSDAALITTDKKLLHAALSNICSNSVKYTPDNGSVQCSASLDKRKKNMVFAISDTGFGIPYEQQKNMLTKFFRADNARKKHPEGNGLGLYIARSFIERLGGTIWFTSEENKGSTFYVSVPLTPPPLASQHLTSPKDADEPYPRKEMIS